MAEGNLVHLSCFDQREKCGAPRVPRELLEIAGESGNRRGDHIDFKLKGSRKLAYKPLVFLRFAPAQHMIDVHYAENKTKFGRKAMQGVQQNNGIRAAGDRNGNSIFAPGNTKSRNELRNAR
jgi:hypothetical protein